MVVKNIVKMKDIQRKNRLFSGDVTVAVCWCGGPKQGNEGQKKETVAKLVDQSNS